MRIVLAGHNVDVEVLREFRNNFLEPVAKEWTREGLCKLSKEALEKKASALGKQAAELLAQDNLTPETISAAYARISRDARPVDELRAIARTEVEKARKSNDRIIFGFGHSSVAEHAAFNIDVIGVSRYAVEEIQKFRLLAFTEKSQRYILLEDDFVVPEEIKKSGLENLFTSTIKSQNACYHRLFEKLRPWVFEQNAELAVSKKNHGTLEGWAKEDARYIVSLATEAQMGMTISARNLEHVISRCASNPVAEVREYGEKLFAAIKDVAPSLVKYTDASEYNVKTRQALDSSAEEVFAELGHLSPSPPAHTERDVSLVDATPEADILLATALLHSASSRTIEECRSAARAMGEEERTRFIAETFRHMKGHDSVLREFENVRCVFEITLSAACFGQLKRHRMATMNTQPYDPALGVTTPLAITAAGAEGDFMGVVEETNAAFNKIAERAPLAAPYVLTNAHRRRVLFTANA
ncbi:MAG: hypothetical protein HOL05_14005, partial [Nitrospinaceae bacterium]|nr:hypothetical protein [Nitrospinaceae bacterium]